MDFQNTGKPAGRYDPLRKGTYLVLVLPNMEKLGRKTKRKERSGGDMATK